jgi:hypothetical protein
MRLYHRSSPNAAASILAVGFRDGEGYYLSDTRWRGVWLSDDPYLDITMPGVGGTLIEATIGVPPERLAEYEWVEAGKGYREFLVPAELINARSTLRVVPDSERWEITLGDKEGDDGEHLTPLPDTKTDTNPPGLP